MVEASRHVFTHKDVYDLLLKAAKEAVEEVQDPKVRAKPELRKTPLIMRAIKNLSDSADRALQGDELVQIHYGVLLRLLRNRK